MAFVAIERRFFLSAVVLSKNKTTFLAREDYSPFLKCPFVVASSLSIGLGNPGYDFLYHCIYSMSVRQVVKYLSAVLSTLLPG